VNSSKEWFISLKAIEFINTQDHSVQLRELMDALPYGLILLGEDLCVYGFNSPAQAFFCDARGLTAYSEFDKLAGMLLDIAADSSFHEAELLIGHIRSFEECTVDYRRYDGKHYRISAKPSQAPYFRLSLLITDISDIMESEHFLTKHSRALAKERSALLSRLRFADAVISERESRRFGRQYSGRLLTVLDHIKDALKTGSADAGLAELERQRSNAGIQTLNAPRSDFTERLKGSLLPPEKDCTPKIEIHHISPPKGCGETLENCIIEAARESVLLIALCGAADSVGIGLRSYDGGMELSIHCDEPIIPDFKTAEPYMRLKKLVKRMRADLETDMSNGFDLRIKCVFPVKEGLPVALVSLSDTRLASRFCETLGGGAEPIVRCIAAAPNIDLKKACQKYKPAILIAQPGLIEKHTEALRGLDNKLKVIAISAPGDNVSGALRLYLDACLPGKIGLESLRAAISGVLCGLTVYSGKNTLSRTEDAVRQYGLSEIEQNILRMIGQGFSSEKIAADLHYSHGSLRNMLSAIYVRLGIGDRAQLTAFAILNGFADSFQGGE